MKYIRRRLFVAFDDKKEIISEDDFLKLPGLKVILGEPGAGKSSMVENLLTDGAKSFSARLVASGALKPTIQTGQIGVIDGIDEVSTYSASGKSVIDVLGKVPLESLRQCVVTCRAADWSAAVDEQDLVSIGCTPVVGTLMPLENDEIKAVIRLHKSVSETESFIQGAEEAGAIELIRNPQMLLMFMQTVASESAFPKTMLELYEKASLALVKENNSAYLRLNMGRRGPDELLKASSFICSLLVLGNYQGVDIEGTGSLGIASVDEFIHGEYDVGIVRAALGTKIFRQNANHGLIDVCHRTVAEFLAAQFIGRSLAGSLSLRRLETLLYGPSFVVPTAFRGLHAWLAVLHADVTRIFIKRDPYGILQYGDLQNISPDDVIFLIRCLDDLAEADPFFRSEALPKGSARGIARPELMGFIWTIISDPEKPPRLRVLLLECLRGSHLIQSMGKELEALLVDFEDVLSVRAESLNILVADFEESARWKFLHSKLISAEDFGSLKLARDLLKMNISLFSGQEVVESILRHSCAARSQDGEGVEESGFAAHMSDVAIAEAIVFIRTIQLGEANEEDRSGLDLETFRLEALKEVASREIVLAPETIWRELEFQSKANEFLPAEYNLWFYEVDFGHATRFALHEYVLYYLEDCPMSSSASYIRRVSPILALTENESIYFLEKAFARHREERRSKRVWRDVLYFASNESDFVGIAVGLAKKQAEHSKGLKRIFEEVTMLRANAAHLWGQYDNIVSAEINRRHIRFQESRDNLRGGRDFQACLDIAKAFIGFPNPLDLGEGRFRVKELVGAEMVDFALNSFAPLLSRIGIPSVREISELRAKEADSEPSIWQWEPVLIAYCVYAPNLALIAEPLGKTALVLQYWQDAGERFSSTMDLYDKLRAVMLPDARAKTQFLRDLLEPFFVERCEWVPSLELLSEDCFFDDVLGALAFEWLIADSWDFAPTTIITLLKAVILSGDRDELLPFVQRKTLYSIPIDRTEQGIWVGLLFGMEYEMNREFFESFESFGPATLIGFHSGLSIIEEEVDFTVEQSYYIVRTFADDLCYTAIHFGGDIFDDEHTYAYEFIRDHVGELALSSQAEVEVLLQTLIDEEVGNFDLHEDIKASLVQNRRMRAELAAEGVTLEKVRGILLSGRPSNAAELQSVVMDELFFAQRLVKFDSVDRYQFFWESTGPKLENACRDSIVTMLEPRLQKYGIRVSTESRMPGNTRSDILLTIGEINLSIELKCQWHDKLWLGAVGQLQDYASDFRADGYGIYLVVFFGDVLERSREIKKSQSGKIAATGEELMQLLEQECRPQVSLKSCFFVWDVSLPSKARGSRNLGSGVGVYPPDKLSIM